MNTLAQIKLYDPGKGFLQGFGPLGGVNPTATAAESTFTKFLSNIIGLMTIIAIIWFIFVFLTGAISIIFSGGDKAALEAARKKITSGIIGLVVTIVAVILVDIIGEFIGIRAILDIEGFVNLIAP